MLDVDEPEDPLKPRRPTPEVGLPYLDDIDWNKSAQDAASSVIRFSIYTVMQHVLYTPHELMSRMLRRITLRQIPVGGFISFMMSACAESLSARLEAHRPVGFLLESKSVECIQSKMS